MKQTHLAIIKRSYLNAIIAGKKTIELRLTKTRTAPFGRICKGDQIYLKASAGPVMATAAVARILKKQNLRISLTSPAVLLNRTDKS